MFVTYNASAIKRGKQPVSEYFLFYGLSYLNIAYVTSFKVTPILFNNNKRYVLSFILSLTDCPFVYDVSLNCLDLISYNSLSKQSLNYIINYCDIIFLDSYYNTYFLNYF